MQVAGGRLRMDLQIDSFDIRLLNLIQHNNLAGAAELAKHVPLSASAITRRLRRLRDKGIIARDIALLSPHLLQSRVRALVLLQLQEHSETALGDLRNSLGKAEQVQSCFEISGGFDVAVMVIARDLAAFNEFADEAFARNPAVRRYESSFIKKEIKNLPLVPLDEADAA
ncbi:MAG TPA: Lrp/AsnC family transcriptional regulator [Sphingomicrobium sp.]|nr:Lrp/AsnC family transcriptional regulator [Sphingomicrobium sp.]